MYRCIRNYALFILMSAASALHGWTIHNKTNIAIEIEATYHGEIPGFSCTTDVFTVAAGEKATKKAGWCAIKSLRSTRQRVGGLPSASGTEFRIVEGPSGRFIEKGN
jgi:hypothetical protein